jgi:hypothetical protein
MKSAFRILIAYAAAAALAIPVAAQDAPIKRARLSAEDPLAKRVSLDLKAMAPADAFAALATSASLKVVVDPAVTAPVDILVRNVTARTALTTMCESIGCEWTVADGTLSIMPGRARKTLEMTGYTLRASRAAAGRITALLKTPLRADMKFDNASLGQVSERVSQALGVKVEISSTDTALQHVTIDLGGVTLGESLRKIAAMSAKAGQVRLALTVSVDPDGKGQVRTIMIAVDGKSRVQKTAVKK